MQLKNTGKSREWYMEQWLIGDNNDRNVATTDLKKKKILILREV